MFGQDQKIFFQPFLQKEYIFQVSEAQLPADITMYLKGSMAKYATVEPAAFALRPGEQKDVKLRISLPETIPDGVHLVELSATETPLGKKDEGMLTIPGVGVSLKVINTDVDFDCGLDFFKGGITGDTLSITLNLGNNGRQPVYNAYADLALHDTEGVLLYSGKTNVVSIPPFESTSIRTSAALNNAEPDLYYIKGTAFCGEKKFQLNQEIIKSASKLEVHEFRAVKKDGYLHVEYDIENVFKVPIEAFSFLAFDTNGKHITDLSIAPTTIGAANRKILSFIERIDWLQIPAGEYVITGTLGYAGKSEIYKTTVTFNEEELKLQNRGGGFGVRPSQEVTELEESQEKVIVQAPKGIEIEKSTMIRIIAGILILAVLILILFKIFSKKK